MTREKDLNTLWVQNLKSPEERESFKGVVLGESRNKVLMRLRDVVKQKYEVLSSAERNPSVYDNPNWAYQQAHNNGALQTLKMLEDMLQFIE